MADSVTTRPLRILHAEDDPADADLVQLALQESGLTFTVDTVSGEEDFARRVSAGGYDVVLSDYNLGMWNGQQALQIAQSAGREAPFILVTGTIGDTLAVELIKQGVSDYVLKDQLPRLGVAIRYALEDRRLRREREAAEEEIRRINSELEERVRLRTAELEEAVQQLQTEVEARIRVSEWLRESEERLNLALQSAAFGTWNWNIPQNLITWDNYVYPLFGLKPGQFGGKYSEFLERVHPDDRASAERTVAAAVEEGRDYDAEFRVVWPDGGIRVLGSRGKVYRDDTGQPLRMTGVYWDLSDRKRAEEAVIKAKEEAERANRLKDQFLSTVNHELRTPLNAVLGFAQILGDDRHGSLNPNQKHYLKNIYDGGKHLLSLINDVLDLSKIEAGRMELAYETLSARVLLAEVTDALKILADKKGHQLHLHADAELYIRGDRRRLCQVLLNLGANGIKFTPERGRIEIGMRRAGVNLVRIEVADSGPGISAQDHALVFESFRCAGPHHNRPDSTGLGLTISKRLVELHGSELKLHSEVGKGSQFYFELPAVQPVKLSELTPQSRALGKPQPANGLPRVLVIEDDAVAASLIETHLKSAGFEVACCLQPGEAVQWAEQFAPEVITLDLLMPVRDGWQVLRELRRGPRTRDVPVIILSILDQTEMGLALGAREYLMKPIEPEHLLQAVGRCLTAADAGRSHVLVVEDHEPTRNLLAELLRDAGYKVEVAADGLEARNRVAASPPAVVLLDLLLPHINGFELLVEWRGRPATANMPVLVLTGKELTEEESSFLHKQTLVTFRKSQDWKNQLLHEIARVIHNKAEAVP